MVGLFLNFQSLVCCEWVVSVKVRVMAKFTVLCRSGILFWHRYCYHSKLYCMHVFADTLTYPPVLVTHIIAGDFVYSRVFKVYFVSSTSRLITDG